MVEGELVGFVSFTIDPNKRTGDLGLNAVHPEHAGLGIGTLVYEPRSGAHEGARRRGRVRQNGRRCEPRASTPGSSCV